MSQTRSAEAALDARTKLGGRRGGGGQARAGARQILDGIDDDVAELLEDRGGLHELREGGLLQADLGRMQPVFRGRHGCAARGTPVAFTLVNLDTRSFILAREAMCVLTTLTTPVPVNAGYQGTWGKAKQ